jgi:vanillate O-demethylase ferredoxin subunit
MSQTNSSQLLSLLVRQIRFESIGINSYELVDPQGAALPVWTAGSHLDIHLPGGIVRQYSLCSDPANHKSYVIAVLKDENGRGGSRLLHETIKVQQIVSVSRPRNNFGLDARARRYLLLGAGIGITPLRAMALQLSAEGKDFDLYYCAKSPAHAAFRDELAATNPTTHFYYDGGNPGRGLDVASLLEQYTGGTHLYYCGPDGFMAACASASVHWPQGSVHSEHFKAPIFPVAQSSGAAPDHFAIEIASTGAVFDVPVDVSIVEVLHEAGIMVETSCVSGLCGTCKTRYLSGMVDHRDFILDEDERKTCLTVCVSRANSHKLVLDL